MLIERCPNLEHLAIDGHSPHAPVSAQGLFQGRWPKLRTLLIGDIVFDWHQIGALDKPFSAFLNAHRNLDALHLHSHAPSVAAPAMLTDLHVDALANLRTFSGALGQAQALPARTRAALKSLRVHDALVLREGTPLSIGGALAALPTLTSLSITFRLEHGYENGSVLRAIVGACPYLRHLDLTVTCRPSLTLVRCSPHPSSYPRNVAWTPPPQDTFSRSIRPLAHLRTLALRIVPSPGEAPLRICGTRLVRASPRLSSFELVFLERGGAPLPRARASFVLVADCHGLPLTLHVVERHKRRLFWMGEAVSRATLEMRPVGAQRTSLVALVVERSTAGEEARLLLLCVALLVVVVWGCIAL
jgi:hypothetical protein